MPISVLAMATSPNSASWIGPTTSMITNSVPTIRLNSVKTLARTISRTLRLVPRATMLTWPLATRSATSAVVRPSPPRTVGEVAVTRRG